jgi:hypothetical protein
LLEHGAATDAVTVGEFTVADVVVDAADGLTVCPVPMAREDGPALIKTRH